MQKADFVPRLLSMNNNNFWLYIFDRCRRLRRELPRAGQILPGGTTPKPAPAGRVFPPSGPVWQRRAELVLIDLAAIRCGLLFG
jgi:hypothetical protein